MRPVVRSQVATGADSPFNRDGDQACQGQVGRADQLDAVHRVLETPEQTDRRIMIMLLDDGLTEIEVARRMALKVTTVRQRKSRMIRRLRERLREP
jgi:DNA-directed RNA polymerase specialized sigma24 family protein